LRLRWLCATGGGFGGSGFRCFLALLFSKDLLQRARPRE
jgi:hypothetical protein